MIRMGFFHSIFKRAVCAMLMIAHTKRTSRKNHFYDDDGDRAVIKMYSYI